MSEAFLKIVNMSISASWLVLMVSALRLLLKKAPRWVNVLLWGLVAVRLICPFSIESAMSLIPSTEIFSPTVLIETPGINTGIPAINNAVNPIIQDAVITLSPEKSVNTTKFLIQLFSRVWAVGVFLLLAYSAVSVWRLRRQMHTAVILRDNIFLSEFADSPFVLGALKPRIYLPYGMDEQSMTQVIAHEKAHIRRRDHWWKPLGFFLLTIHWFNPLMWLAYILLCRDIELACDEKVIKELGNEERADYSQALVACSVSRLRVAACPLAFGEVGVKERVKNVMNYKKPAFWIVLLAAVTCIVVAVCFLTDPPANVDAPFGGRYSVKEIAYADLRYSFNYTTKTAPKFDFTSDHQLFVAGDALHSANPTAWEQHPGYFQETTLTNGNFDDYFVEPSDRSCWSGDWTGAELLRSQTKQAWRLDVDGSMNGDFYYLLLTENDDVLLCCGYDTGESQEGIVDRTLIRWVFVLQPGLEPEASAYEPRGVSGSNVKELSRVPDNIQWQSGIGFGELAPGEEILSDQEIVIEEDGTSVLLTISWDRASLFLEYGIRRDDGTKFFQEKRGGYGHLKIDDIPAGTYRLYIKNSDAYTGIPAYENPAAFQDVSFEAAGAMNYALN